MGGGGERTDGQRNSLSFFCLFQWCVCLSSGLSLSSIIFSLTLCHNLTLPLSSLQIKRKVLRRMTKILVIQRKLENEEWK